MMDAFSKDDYLSAHRQFLPMGLAWSWKQGGVLRGLLAGFSRSYASLHDCLIRLSTELDPRITSSLLNEWESFAGLPDACSFSVSTDSERRTALVAKLTANGGSSAGYFISIAQALGYANPGITEFTVFRCGRSRCGDRLYGVQWRHVWQMNLVSNTHDATLQCRVLKLKPAHTKVIFNYAV